MSVFAPLTDDEAALLYHAQRYGSDGYPITKVGSRHWHWSFRSVKGPIVVFKTKRSALASFDAWIDLALERWREMKAERPHAILTAVGIKGD